MSQRRTLKKSPAANPAGRARTNYLSRRVLTNDLKNPYPQYKSLPDSKIYNHGGNSEVVINLKPNQTIYTNGSTMIWMDAAIEVKTKTTGIWGGIRRAFAGDNMFLPHYTGVNPKGNKICLASHLPGDMTKLLVKPGTKKLIASNSVVCCTANVKLDMKFSARGIFAGDAFLTTVSVPDDSPEPGMVWIGAFGSINTIELKDGEKYKIDNFHFLASGSGVNYTLGTLTGGLKNKLLSGEGIVMNFTGPCNIMIQNRNLGSFAHKLSHFMPHNGGSGASWGDIL
jgi:uncharacterized protein (TIGR00266 family)